jgi:hypothetical protein
LIVMIGSVSTCVANFFISAPFATYHYYGDPDLSITEARSQQLV